MKEERNKRRNKEMNRIAKKRGKIRTIQQRAGNEERDI
jgi:hypothetical protein